MDLIHQYLTYETMRPVYKFALIMIGTILLLSGKSHIGASGVASGIHTERKKERATQEELDMLIQASMRLYTKGELRFVAAALCLFFAGEV